MKTVSKEQIKFIHTLINQYAKHRGFEVEKEEKASFVAECSDGRCTSTKDLTQAEAKVLIESLQYLFYSTDTFQDADRKRKRILYYAYQMNWTKNKELDYARIDNWCVKYGYLHKALMKHSNKELVQLVQQFHKMYIAFLKSI